MLVDALTLTLTLTLGLGFALTLTLNLATPTSTPTLPNLSPNPKPGDAADLVHVDDAPHALVPPRVAPLASAMAAALRSNSFNLTRLAPARSAQATATAWRSLHRCVAAVYSHAVAHHTLTRESSARREAGQAVMASVVLVTKDRPALLQHALTSLEAQDHEKLEVVLVDDGSATLAAVATLEALERPDSAFSLRGCVGVCV